MSLKLTADEVDEILRKERANQSAAIAMIEERILDAWRELSPTVEVLKKYGIPFRNSAFDGKTACGILVGKGKAADGVSLLIVLGGKLVFLVEEGKDEIDVTKNMTLEDFIRIADFDSIRDGLDFVRNVHKTVVEVEEAYSKRLISFVTELEAF